MKSGNKKSNFANLAVKQQPQPQERIIRVNFLDEHNNLLQAYDHDAMSMSQKFPDDLCLTVYHNGIPTTMSVKQLVKETLLQIQGEIKG